MEIAIFEKNVIIFGIKKCHNEPHPQPMSKNFQRY